SIATDQMGPLRRPVASSFAQPAYGGATSLSGASDTAPQVCFDDRISARDDPDRRCPGALPGGSSGNAGGRLGVVGGRRGRRWRVRAPLGKRRSKPRWGLDERHSMLDTSVLPPGPWTVQNTDVGGGPPSPARSLEEHPFAWDALEGLGATRLEHKASTSREVLDGARDEHFTRPGERADPGRSVDGDARDIRT